MENNVRFRNHISIVAERMGSVLIFVFLAFMSGLSQNIKTLLEKDIRLDGKIAEALLPILAVLAVFLLIVIWQVVVWSKTYISIVENTIVIEKNTLNRRKNTIGIKNISNVNTEQNLFEMILGTCKVKLDTDSLSTADKTDVKIVLKKAEAEKFRLRVMTLMRQAETGGAEAVPEPEAAVQYDIEAGPGDMLVHGLFSMNLFSVLILAGCIVGTAELFTQVFGAGTAEKGILAVLGSAAVLIFFFFSALWDIVKGFVQYYDFKVKRLENKIYLSYGLFKKVHYTIPVDKVNAVKLTQSLQARASGRYMAELINVGMGDDGSEKKAFLILYSSKKDIQKYLQQLLPEFPDILAVHVQRQPKSVWAAWLIPVTGVITMISAGLLGILEFWPGFLLRTSASAAGIAVLCLAGVICRYLTAGVSVEDRYLKVAAGYVRRSILCVSYDKIQHLEVKQNFIAQKAGIQKGTIYLLASALNVTQSVPYFKERELLKIKKRMLKSDQKK
ncbi:PH domain-containing protein [Anaerostipes sp.]|uniref:PH domain-containing protein n=1 Tax=Anaerostipes sp. TaxID=1872530 RepID=UPI0025B96856|nr:PH domain-containing protein [Anaerostipes sp.]MBS7007992.1 PH domain-containing protein [Anaerostipes sp.]